MNIISGITNVVGSVQSGVSKAALRGTDVLLRADTGYFDNVRDNILNALNEFEPFVWLIALVAVVVIGLLCMIGSDRSKEAAKSKALYVILGAAIIVSAEYIAKFVVTMFGGKVS